MGTRNYKSVFILRVYRFDLCEKPSYSVDKYEIKRNGYAAPSFKIYESETGIFETLAQAEKQIRKLTGNEDIYSFLVEEKPVGGTFYTEDALSRRRYLKDGKLWQKCDVSSVRCFNGKDVDLGEVNFYGRNPQTLPFKEGDIVEIAYNDYARLAIIWKLPPSVDYMKTIWDQHKNLCKKNPLSSRVHPDESEDAYTILFYYVDKDGEINHDVMHAAVYETLPLSFPVSRKSAAELRRRLEKFKDEYERYEDECGDVIPF